MGSIASHPKVPTVQTLYVPVAPPVPTPAITTSAISAGPTTDGPADPETSPAARSASLLDRSRGMLSTVLTGFRGLLSETGGPHRKSLLGE